MRRRILRKGNKMASTPEEKVAEMATQTEGEATATQEALSEEEVTKRIEEARKQERLASPIGLGLI